MKRFSLIFFCLIGTLLANAQNGVYIQAYMTNSPDISVAVTFSINSEPETIATAITDTDGEIDIFFVEVPDSEWSTITASFANCEGEVITATQYNNSQWPLVDIYFELDYCGSTNIWGCTDPVAINYNPEANNDDGSCIYEEGEIVVYNDSLGCAATFILEGIGFDTEVLWSFGDDSPNVWSSNSIYHYYAQGGEFLVCAFYYAPDGTTREACTSVFIFECQNDIYGCTDPTALNYNPQASIDDGSCEYQNDVPNDLCAEAIPLDYGTNVVDNTGAYQNENIWGECWGFGQGEGEQSSVWYSFTTPDYPATIDLVAYGDGTNSLTDTQFGLFQECGGEMIHCDGNSANGLYSAFHFQCGDLLEGTDYILMIDGWSGDAGTCLLDFQVGEDCNQDVYGCTDPAASNYNPLATIDNGTCQYFDSCGVYFSTVTSSCNTFIICAYGLFDNVLVSGTWSVNGVMYDEWNSIVTFVFDEPGTYDICFESDATDCNNGMECTTLTVAPDCFNTCPEMIIESDPNGCGAWHYLTGVDQEQEFLWYFGDGSSQLAISGVYHEYDAPGLYNTCVSFEPTENCFYEEICGYAEINGCEGDVYGCTDPTALNYDPLATIDDGSCFYPDSCAVEIYADQLDCNSYVFYAYSEFGPDFVAGTWTVNQQVVQEWSDIFTFQADEPGEYEICFEGVTGNCETGFYECTWIYVDPTCFETCPYLNVSLGDSACTATLELANVDPQQNVDWYIDNLEPFNADAFTTFEFETNGWHSVCAVYQQEGCPDVEYCTEIYTSGCAVIYGCTNPAALNYNPEATIDDGSCEFISECDENIVEVVITTDNWGYEISWELDFEGLTVAEGSGYQSYELYTSTHCLPDGCYVLHLLDSYGDGWNGGTYTIMSEGNIISSGTLENGFSGIVEFGINADGCNTMVYGCMDPNALNYNPDATIDDGSCEYESDCNGYETTLLINNNTMDMGQWTLSIGDVIIAQDSIFNDWHDALYCLEDGCYTLTFEMDQDATSEANFFTVWEGQDIMLANDWLQPGYSSYQLNVGSGCGNEDIYGCMDENATNYNPEATIDDGSCYYEFDCDVSFTVFPDSTGGSTMWVVPDVNLWNAQSVVWDFGDGTTSTELFPTHVYAGDGPYLLCVTVVFTQGETGFCQVTYCVEITADMLDNGAGFQSGFTINVIESEDVLNVTDAHNFTEFTLWPNPTSNFVNLNFTSVKGSEATISIMDISGKRVYQELIGIQNGEMNKEIDVHNLAPGMYMVSIQNEFGIATSRFVVSR